MRAFADTSFYVAILSAKDNAHTKARQVADAFRGQTITTEYVLVEVANWLSAAGDRNAFVLLNQNISRDPNTLVIPASRALYDAGVGLYAKRSDKMWSLTDCISFVVMQQNELADALTADRHFQQAGFRPMLLN